MLYITVEGGELFNEATQEFVSVNSTRLQLEHSLVSISKWEAKHHKCFLKNLDKLTPEELVSYIECMTMTQNVNPDTYRCLSIDNLKAIQDYINDPMTATFISEKPSETRTYGGHKEAMTAEVIYYWMIAQNIPMECQKWHLNRLLTLIRVCSIKNNPKKMSKAQAMAHNKSLNAKRRRH